MFNPHPRTWPPSNSVPGQSTARAIQRPSNSPPAQLPPSNYRPINWYPSNCPHTNSHYRKRTIGYRNFQLLPNDSYKLLQESFLYVRFTYYIGPTQNCKIKKVLLCTDFDDRTLFLIFLVISIPWDTAFLHEGIGIMLYVSLSRWHRCHLYTVC